MKKRLFALSIIVVMCVTLCACGKKKDGLSTKETTVKLDVGKTYVIELEQGEVDGIQWSSDNEAVATVSSNGTVTGKRSGVAVITGRTEDAFVLLGVIVEGKDEYVDNNGNVVKVYNEPSNIKSITVRVKNGGNTDITIKKGETYSLIADTDPKGSTDKIDWESDNTSAVAVNKDGVISAVGKGSATIKAIAPNGVEGKILVRVK